MRLGRRSFFTSAALAGGASLIPRTAAGFTLPDPTQMPVLRLSCQESRIPGDTLTEKLDFLEANQFTGIEPGGEHLPGRVTEFKNALRNRRVRISAICAGFQGYLISPDKADRDLAVRTMKEIMAAAGELDAAGLIVVPAFNRQPSLPYWEARERLVDLLEELGDYGTRVNSRILLEPLNRAEAFFLRQVADAAAICRDVASDGVGVIGDFWHMTREETSDLGAFVSAGDRLHHVHIASRRNRMMPGENEEDNYIDGFRGLKLIGYNKYVSLECGTQGDPRTTIPAAGQLIREQWDMA